MTDRKEPRRFKLPREFDDEDRTLRKALGGGDRRFERPEYIAWRTQTLEDEHDDVALRARLLEEAGEALRQQAADSSASNLDAMSPEDWAVRNAARRDGRNAPLPGADLAARLEADASELEDEAAELRQYTMEEAA